MQTVMKEMNLDLEWVTLIMKAKNSGLTKEEVRLLLMEMQE